MGTTDRLWSYIISLITSTILLLFCVFDNEKFVNYNELTAVEPIDDITIHMESPEIKDKLLVGQCIAIYINRSTSCIACNKIQPVNNVEEFVTCKNCKMATLASISNKACFANDDQNNL